MNGADFTKRQRITLGMKVKSFKGKDKSHLK